MLTTIAKRIQSRLSRAGVKVSLGEIKEQCDRLISDIENPTEEALLAVHQYFLSNASQLSVVANDVVEVDVDTVDNIYTPPVDSELYIEEAEEEEAIAPQTEPAPLAVSPKNELVAAAAGELGIVLNTQEMELIASNVNYSSDDLQESLEEIKSAIIAFVRHRIALNSQMIDETLEEITQVATDGFSANSQQLTDGLQNINKQLQQQSTDFKSKVRSTLKCFQLPAAS